MLCPAAGRGQQTERQQPHRSGAVIFSDMCRLERAGDGREDAVDLATQDAQDDNNNDSDENENEGVLDQTLALLQLVELAHSVSSSFP